MDLKAHCVTIFSLLSLMLGKVLSVLSPSNKLMSDEAIELLNDPLTRDEYIKFATGINDQGKKKEEHSKTTKTFTKEDGKKITVMKFS